MQAHPKRAEKESLTKSKNNVPKDDFSLSSQWR
jgi:hypothetical protein